MSILSFKFQVENQLVTKYIRNIMKFEKGFDPGHHNTYSEVNFGPNSQYLPNVTEVTIINGGAKEDKPTANKEPESNKDLTAVKADILTYTSRIAYKLKPEWMNAWERFWKGLLDEDVIENEIGKISKQQGTTFNRMFVCKIIHYLADKQLFSAPYSPSEMARALEGNDQHTIRTHGLNWNPDEAICKRIDRFIELFNL